MYVCYKSFARCTDIGYSLPNKKYATANIWIENKNVATRNKTENIGNVQCWEIIFRERMCELNTLGKR